MCIRDSPYYLQVSETAKLEHAAVLPICAGLEAELADMDQEEKAMFLADVGLSQSGLDRLILSLIHIFGR